MSGLKRYNILDLIRGFCVINMVLYHALWDIVYIFGTEMAWYSGTIGHLWQQCICWTFILLSGFCFNLGKHKLKRGLIVFGWGLVVSLVTLIFMPESPIIFGVLTLIGSAMLLMFAFEKVVCKIPSSVGFCVFFALFAFTKKITKGYLGIFTLKLFDLPEFLYANTLTSYFGFTSENFYSSDYFPLMPWFFLFVSGFFLGKIVLQKGLLDKINLSSNKALEFIGKHAIWIYVLHQPIIYGVLYLIYM
ncbi:MAG: heparan-alpha-glucosaminide N-acetyltransferase domain-containing protein [Clostridia bacterium]